MSIKKETLKINGMSCGGCVKSVTRALTQTEGVTVERVEIGLAEITYDPALVTPEAIAAAIDEAGFELAEGV
ncbi:MAG: cation transporter [Rhodothermales bacterium]|nr:cation transporter [Rhodothermales bacterium]